MTAAGAGIVGILLAAGRGSRFDAAGAADKLMQALDGQAVALHAAHALAPCVERVVAVVRPESDRLAALLRDAGCDVSECAQARLGMGHSLAHAATQLVGDRAIRGVVVMLADMPRVRSATIAALVDALRGDDAIVAPQIHGMRGNPVAFGRAHLRSLAACNGDRGASALLKSQRVTLVEVDDPGVLRDVDTPEDLDGLQAR